MNLPSWKTLQSSILPKGGAVDFSQAMCSLASRSQNREAMLEAGAPQAIIRLLVDAIFRRKKLDHGLDNETPNIFPTEEYGPRKLERLHREHSAETSYLSKLSQNCLQMLSHFITDCIDALPSHKLPSNVINSVIPTPHIERSSSFNATSSGPQLPLVIELLIHQLVIDAIKYITNQPKGPCRLAALRVISMIVEWPEALDMVHNQRISDVLVSLFFYFFDFLSSFFLFFLFLISN